MSVNEVDVEQLDALVSPADQLSARHPWLRPLATRVHQARRYVAWWTGGEQWSRTRPGERLPVRIAQHNSLLLRQLGESEMALQHGKVVNLRLAAARTDHLVVAPGESFSFNRVVGNCTRRRGYVDGMRLSSGEAARGVGGGLCQLANLVHWMVLHSPLTVVERSEHSFDPFPDNGRVLPWGVGCSIAWNYVDLVVRNDTQHAFQLLTAVGERYLEGELRADGVPQFSYSVYARHEEFLRRGANVFRRNEIWRDVIDRRSGDRVRSELLRRNCALVKYVPAGVHVREVGAGSPVRPAPVSRRTAAGSDRSGTLSG